LKRKYTIFFRNYEKTCPYCSSKSVKKNGRRNRKQLWKCKDCLKQFRQKSKGKSQEIWKQYTHGKQTQKQLADTYGKSKRWVQYQLDIARVQEVVHKTGDVVIVMDTTYFKHEFGVMVWRCPHRKRNLLWKFLNHETIQEYVAGVEQLQQDGWKIKAIVCDGKRGLFTAFGVPVQMCQFHQAAIVTRYVTKRPKLQAGQELQELMRMLPRTDEASFKYWLSIWHERWKDFLNEKTLNEWTGKSHYTHKRLRSAYRSLQTNLPYLFTYEKYSYLNIPNTTNSLEATFGHMKDKIRCHRGLKVHRKQKHVEQFLRGEN
jgi:transposase-like protein